MKSPIGLAARGKWKSILTDPRVGGIDPKYLDGNHHSCPVTGEGDDRFRFSDKNGTGSFFCACSDGGGDGFDLLKCCKSWDFKTAAAEVEKVVGTLEVNTKPAKSAEIILKDLRTIKASIIEGRSLVETYLLNRGIETTLGLPRSVRQGKLSYALGAVGVRQAMDAMVSLVQNPEGVVVTFHITYLTSEGSKVDHPRAKVIATPNGDMRGASVRLAEVGEAGVLGVGEGIESSWSAMQLFKVPTWATLSTAGMENFVWPDNLKKLVIYADNDAKFAGQAAAYKLAYKAMTSKRAVPEVEVIVPPEIGTDWNDFLQRSGSL